MSKIASLPPSAGLAAHLSEVAVRFCDYHGIGVGALSGLILNDTRFLLGAVRAAEADEPFPFHSRRYDRAMGHLAALWPADLEWPVGVPIPEAVAIEKDKEPEVRHRLRHLLAEKRKKEAKGGTTVES